jgi:hypothetical protein
MAPRMLFQPSGTGDWAFVSFSEGQLPAMDASAMFSVMLPPQFQSGIKAFNIKATSTDGWLISSASIQIGDDFHTLKLGPNDGDSMWLDGVPFNSGAYSGFEKSEVWTFASLDAVPTTFEDKSTTTLTLPDGKNAEQFDWTASSFFMESMVVAEVLDSEWKTVSLSEIYVSPIAVCTVEYEGTGTDLRPAVVRMKDVGPNSFEITLQNPNDDSLEDQGRDVHCVVVEKGSWDMPDGRKIEANKYESIVTDDNNAWVGEEQYYANSYTNPIVLGQVMSYNDVEWSVFWSRGSGLQEAPSSSKLFTGKHVGEDESITRENESIGYIVIEAGHATSVGIEIETARGADTAVGYVDGSKKYDFVKPFSTKPAVAVLSQVGMDGGDGSWALLAKISSKVSMNVAVDEDTFLDGRDHTTEEVDYIVFSTAGPVPLYSNSA